jgi:hypothetical protein
LCRTSMKTLLSCEIHFLLNLVRIYSTAFLILHPLTLTLSPKGEGTLETDSHKGYPYILLSV